MELVVRKVETGCTPRLMAREWNNINRDAVRNAGAYWHTRFRPLHFRNLATARYGYALRQGEGMGAGERGFFRTYTGQKLKNLGHTRPLVGWKRKGQGVHSEQLSEIQDIRATATGGQYGTARARVVMHTPTLNFRPHPTSPDMRKELTTVIPAEEQELTSITRAFLEQRYRFIQLTEVTLITAGGPY